MNLHGIVAPVVAAVNPLIPVTVRISAGASATSADGSRAPLYETPGSFTGSIDGTEMTITAAASGVIAVGQTIAGAGVAAGTVVTGLGTGAGGVGTYQVSCSQSVASGALTTSLNLLGQVQPMTWRDLQQVEGLNLSGTRRKIYLFGSVDSVVRVSRKGGDLIDVAAGVNAGAWLTAQVLEQFPDWVCAAITQQNEQ